MTQETDYPSGGVATFRVVETPPDGLSLRVRYPNWATVERVHLNGEPTSYVVEQNYLRVVKRLRAGDELIVTFPIGLRLEPNEGMLASLRWGPLLMTYEMPGGTAEAVAVPPEDSDGFIRLPPLDPPDHRYAIAGAHLAVIATGCAASELVESLAFMQPQFGRLRPFAEQTANPAPPPASLRFPVIVARTAGPASELARLLGGPGG